MEQTIYIKMRNRLKVCPSYEVKLSDVAQLTGEYGVVEALQNEIVYKITAHDKTHVVIDIMKVIEIIQRPCTWKSSRPIVSLDLFREVGGNIEMTRRKLKDDYINKVKEYHPKPNYLLNCVKAFVVGGLICTFGEVLMKFYIHYFHFSEQKAGNPTVATLVLLSAILTGCGIYDKISQFAGAGLAVPVTGFVNSMASAALEHRSEGVVLGIATNMFKLAGSVIVFGVVGAYIIGLIRYTFKIFMS